MRRIRSLLMLWVLSLLVWQLYFLLRIIGMIWIDPECTSFERAEAVRLIKQNKEVHWMQQWVDETRVANSLKRAVIISEDDGFSTHAGVDWEALSRAWSKNQKESDKAQALMAKLQAKPSKNAPVLAKPPKVVGGSTISQQLAKNLFLSGERTLLRKIQEFIITIELEAFLSKRRILEIYLNHIEWGEGVFGAEAAAQHYFGKHASQLSDYEAARLAVMLPRPKFFEKRPQSAYWATRTGLVLARMNGARLP